MNLDEMELTIRAYNALKLHGYTNTDRITAATASELLSLPNFGRKTLLDLKETLAQYGLRLAGDEDERPDAPMTLRKSEWNAVAILLEYAGLHNGPITDKFSDAIATTAKLLNRTRIPAPPRQPSPFAERNAKIVAAYRAGALQKDIAAHYGLSIPRVWQICQRDREGRSRR